MTFEPKSDAVAEIRIRKYPNRRLYSTADKRFVTLNEIAEWVRQGKRVAVTDSESQTDITSEILTQILLEGGRASHFPVQVLEQMIRLNESTLRGFWDMYLNQSMQMFMGVQREMESFYQNLSPLFGAWSPIRAFNAAKAAAHEKSTESQASMADDAHETSAMADAASTPTSAPTPLKTAPKARKAAAMTGTQETSPVAQTAERAGRPAGKKA